MATLTFSSFQVVHLLHGPRGESHIRNELGSASLDLGGIDAFLLLRVEECVESVDLLEDGGDLGSQCALLIEKILVGVAEARALARRDAAQRLAVDRELVVGGAVESGRGFVQVLDHVQLHENAAKLSHDQPMLLECLHLFLVRTRGVRRRHGLFEVVDDGLDFVLAEPLQGVGDFLEHLRLGPRRQPLEEHGVDGGGGTPRGFLDALLHLLLFVPLFGEIDVLRHGHANEARGEEQRSAKANATAGRHGSLLEARGRRGTARWV